MADAELQEERHPFDVAKDAFDAAEGATRVAERVDADPAGGCPTCHAPMRLIHEYREPEQYHFRGICSADEDHNIERYGYYSNEGSDE